MKKDANLYYVLANVPGSSLPSIVGVFSNEAAAKAYEDFIRAAEGDTRAAWFFPEKIIRLVSIEDLIEHVLCLSE